MPQDGLHTSPSYSARQRVKKRQCVEVMLRYKDKEVGTGLKLLRTRYIYNNGPNRLSRCSMKEKRSLFDKRQRRRICFYILQENSMKLTEFSY